VKFRFGVPDFERLLDRPYKNAYRPLGSNP